MIMSWSIVRRSGLGPEDAFSRQPLSKKGGATAPADTFMLEGDNNPIPPERIEEETRKDQWLRKDVFLF
jgi:hypothetical protein